MSQFSHYPLQEIPLVIAYPSAGPHESYAVVHAAGCAHTHRASTQVTKTLIRDLSPEDGYDDDYYVVAPCARAKGSTRHVLDH